MYVAVFHPRATRASRSAREPRWPVDANPALVSIELTMSGPYLSAAPPDVCAQSVFMLEERIAGQARVVVGGCVVVVVVVVVVVDVVGAGVGAAVVATDAFGQSSTSGTQVLQEIEPPQRDGLHW